MAWVQLVALLALLECIFFAYAVGKARETYQLKAKHGRTMDLPILGFATALAGKGKGDTTAFDALRSLVAANPIGPNRAQAGMP